MSHELAYLQLKPVSQIHLLVEDQEEGCMPQMGRKILEDLYCLFENLILIKIKL